MDGSGRAFGVLGFEFMVQDFGVQEFGFTGSRFRILGFRGLGVGFVICGGKRID